MIYIGVDPGNYWGIATWYPELQPKPDAIEVLAEDGGDVLENLFMVMDGQDMVLGCEIFTPSNRVKTYQPDVVRGEGIVSFLCRKYDVPLYWQQPADVKNLAPDAKLRKLGWYQQTKDGHANDGMRHLLRVMSRTAPDVYAGVVGL